LDDVGAAVAKLLRDQFRRSAPEIGSIYESI
jgi:hypothetical protein